MAEKERVWTIEVTENLLMDMEISPVFRVFGTREYAREIQQFLGKLMVSTVLTRDGLMKHYGIESGA